MMRSHSRTLGSDNLATHALICDTLYMWPVSSVKAYLNALGYHT